MRYGDLAVLRRLMRGEASSMLGNEANGAWEGSR